MIHLKSLSGRHSERWALKALREQAGGAKLMNN